jgi:hypothetical protein
MQINSKEGELTYKNLAARINALLHHDYRQKMLQRVLLAMAKNLDASTMHVAEDRRVLYEEWEAVKTMREADALDRANPALADDIGNIAGALGAENEMNDGESGAL